MLETDAFERLTALQTVAVRSHGAMVTASASIRELTRYLPVVSGRQHPESPIAVDTSTGAINLGRSRHHARDSTEDDALERVAVANRTGHPEPDYGVRRETVSLERDAETYTGTRDADHGDHEEYSRRAVLCGLVTTAIGVEGRKPAAGARSTSPIGQGRSEESQGALLADELASLLETGETPVRPAAGGGTESVAWGCDPETAGRIWADPIPDEDVSDELNGVLEEAEQSQHGWVEGANEHLDERGFYDGPIYARETITNAWYAADALEPSWRGVRGPQDAERYGILCRMRSHPEGAIRDIDRFADERPEEAEITLSFGLELLVIPLIELPVEEQEQMEVPAIGPPPGFEIDEAEREVRAERFQEAVAGIRAQIVDEFGNYAEVYLSEGVVDDFTREYERGFDFSDVRKAINSHITPKVEIHSCGLVDRLLEELESRTDDDD